jgi:hypothetical protein
MYMEPLYGFEIMILGVGVEGWDDIGLTGTR